MRTRIFNKEVLYPDEKLVRVSRGDIQTLVAQAETNERKRMRLCAHHDVQDPLHEMIIVHARDTYVRPHKHIQKSESFHVIEGRVDVIMFDDDGTIMDCISMGDYASGLEFYYRNEEPIFHTLIIRSDILVFHEATNGPFNPNDTNFALWAPDGKDPLAAVSYMGQVDRALQQFIKENEGKGRA